MSGISLWLLILLTLVALVGIFVNSYLLIVLLFSRSHSSVDNLLLLHLVILNLCLGSTFLAFSAPGLVYDNWLADGSLCYLHGFLFTILHPLALWTVCGLNVNRYYAIAAPLNYEELVNPRKVCLCLGIGWFISLCLSIFPFVHIAPFAFNSGLGACVPNFQSGRTTLWYSAAYTAFTLLLPTTIIICCNAKILMIAQYHRHRIASAIFEVTLSAQATITHQQHGFFVPANAVAHKFRSRSPVFTIMQLLGTFIFLDFPYYSIILWESCNTFLESKSTIDDHILFYHVVLVLLTLSPIVNGILYGLKNKNLRKTFQNYWRKKVTTSKLNNEIQARTPSASGSRKQSLTPLGFFLRQKNAKHQLSETLLDNKISRLAAELTWRSHEQTDFDVAASGSTTLQVHNAHISECIVDLELGVEETGNVIVEHPLSKNHMTLPIQDYDSAVYSSDQRRKCFMYKCFAAENSKAPKIFITRARSENDTKVVRESGKHSSSVSNLLSKWYNNSDNYLRDRTMKDTSAATKLLWNNSEGEYAYQDFPSNSFLAHHDDSDSDEAEPDKSINFSINTGLYMNLDSDDMLRTQSCNIDLKEMGQIKWNQSSLPILPTTSN